MSSSKRLQGHSEESTGVSRKRRLHSPTQSPPHRNGKLGKMENTNDNKSETSAISDLYPLERLKQAEKEYDTLYDLATQLVLEANGDESTKSNTNANEKVSSSIYSVLCMMNTRIRQLHEDNVRLRRERDEAYRDLHTSSQSQNQPNTERETSATKRPEIKQEEDSNLEENISINPDPDRALLGQDESQNTNSSLGLPPAVAKRIKTLTDENKELGHALSSGAIACLQEDIKSLYQISQSRKDALEESQKIIKQLNQENEDAQEAILRLSQLTKQYEDKFGKL